MAKVSFNFILGMIATVLGIVFFGSPLVANNLTAATPLLIMLAGALTATIGHYNHMVYSMDKLDKDKKNVEDHPK